MSEMAAFLVDEVIPEVPVRQYVLSFPFPIRFWLARNPRLQSGILRITIRAIGKLITKKAKEIGVTQKCEFAVVTVIQRFGGSINLNPHFHSLWVDGVYDEDAKFHAVASPTDNEIKEMVEKLGIRILRYLKRKNYPVDDMTDGYEEEADIFGDVQGASVTSHIALGERKGQKVRRIGIYNDGNFEGAIIEGERCASYRGFSLHANTAAKAHEREKLEHMARYIARPPIAMDRLKERSDGMLTYKLKKAYRDGTEQLLFSPMEIMEKLAALIPKPRGHLTRYHGAFAPHSRLRPKIIRSAQKKKEDTQETPKTTKNKMTWAKLLNRVFKIDITECAFCKSEVKIIAAVLERTAIVKILTHLGHPTEAPIIAQPRAPPQMEFAEF